MAAGDAGPSARLDQGTLSLRLALLHAEEDVDRLRALEELARGKVLAATWPNSPEAVRTLTNSDGEQAMPLFSGLDTLQSAARRFGWLNPEGSFAFRELPAREALQNALAQGVHYVVLDIYADHAAEFARHEIAQVLQLAPRAQPPPAAARAAAQVAAPPPRVRAHDKPSSHLIAPVGSKQPQALAEIDMPFASQRGSNNKQVQVARAALDALDAALPRRPEAPRAPAQAAAAPRMEAPTRPQIARVPVVTRAVQAPPPATRDPRPTPGAFPPPPAARDPRPTPGAFPALRPAAPAMQPVPPPGASAEPVHASGPELDALPVLGTESDGFPLAEHDAAAGFGFDYDEPAPEARPAALEAAAMVAQVGKLAGDADTQKAAAEVAAMLQNMARKGTADDEKPAPPSSAANAFASLLSAEVAADASRKQRNRRTRGGEPAPDPAQSAAAAQPEASATGEHAALVALEPVLPDAVLDAVAEALRKFPEVEWACAVSDGSGLPVLALRVDPAFQARASAISAAALAAAQARGSKVTVLMLQDPQQTRDARACGSAFFPWRRRALKR